MIILKPIVISETSNKKESLFNALSLLVLTFTYNREELQSILTSSEYEKLVIANMTLAKPFIKDAGINSRDWDGIIKLYKSKKYKTSEEDEEYIDNISFSLEKGPAIKSLFTEDEKTFITSWSLFYRRGSIPALNRMKTFVSKVASPNISKFFPLTTSVKKDVKNHKDLLRDIEELSSKVSKNGVENKNHKDYKTLIGLRRDARLISKNIMKNFIREKGKKVDAKDVRDYLDSLGIKHSIPKKFEGLIGEDAYYTMYGEELSIVPTGEVTMNRLYKPGSPNFVFRQLPEFSQTGKEQRVYTKKAIVEKKKQKFSNVDSFIQNIEKYKKNWRKLLMKRDVDFEKQGGVVLELLYLTSARIGTKGNQTKGKKTFGLMFIENKHLRPKGNVVKISFVGKGGSKVRYTIDTKIADPKDKKFINEVISYLKLSKDTGDASDKVFSITPNYLRNQIMRGKLNIGITPHGFRHLQGTKIMNELLTAIKKKIGKEPTAKKVLEEFNKAAKKAGEFLGHYTTGPGGETKITGNTALKNYIDPSVTLDFFNSYPNVKLPAVVKTLKKNFEE